MAVAKGQIEAKVSGSELYHVKVSIKTLPGKKWTTIKGRCSRQIGSLLELLQGRLSDRVMESTPTGSRGCFRCPAKCRSTVVVPTGPACASTSPPYSMGSGAAIGLQARVALHARGVNHEELIEADAEKAVAAATSRGSSKRLAANEIGAVGIEIDADNADASSGNAPSNNGRGKALPKNLPTKNTSGKTKGKKIAKVNGKVKKPAAGKTVKKPAATGKKAKSGLRTRKP